MRTRWIASLALCLSVTSHPVARAQAAPALVADPSHAVSDSRGGGGQAFRIESVILGETRRIGIVLPASYARSAAARRYPVIVVLDGEASLAPMATVCDELARNGQMPEAIVVAIENTNRLRDLTPPGLSVSGSSLHEGGDRFLDFIARELLPALDRQFRAGAPRTLVGHSSGGILATYAAATRSTFRFIVALDTPVYLGEQWLPKKLTAAARAAATAGASPALHFAALDARFSWPDDAWRSLAAAAPRSWTLHHEQLADESHESMPFLGMYLGLRAVFHEYSMLAAPSQPTTSILPYYAKLGAVLGADLAPPRKLMLQVIEDLLIEGRGAAARQAYTAMVAAYGAPPNAADLMKSIADVERRPPPTETVEGLLATPLASPDEARAYVGDWLGGTWMTDDEPRSAQTTLQLREVDGRMVGRSIHHPSPGVDLVQEWTYLRVTPHGLTFGYMNGMRPRGMLLFESTLKDDTLTGIMRFGGVDFRFPDGSAPPPVHFAYRRVK